MLKKGTTAPDFSLQDQNGNEVSLTQRLQNSAVILYFYPSDFTPGCTKEACAIRDIHDEILEVGLDVIGVSPQDARSHSSFKTKHKLPFTLLCDPDKTVIRLYDAIALPPFNVRRITYIINQDQVIEDAISADLRIGRHEVFIKSAIELRASTQSNDNNASLLLKAIQEIANEDEEIGDDEFKAWLIDPAEEEKK